MVVPTCALCLRATLATSEQRGRAEHDDDDDDDNDEEDGLQQARGGQVAEFDGAARGERVRRFEREKKLFSTKLGFASSRAGQGRRAKKSQPASLPQRRASCRFSAGSGPRRRSSMAEWRREGGRESEGRTTAARANVCRGWQQEGWGGEEGGRRRRGRRRGVRCGGGGGKSRRDGRLRLGPRQARFRPASSSSSAGAGCRRSGRRSESRSLVARRGSPVDAASSPWVRLGSCQ